MSYTDFVTAALALSPAALWTLDETSGTAVTDDTGNGRTGTYAGSPSLNQTSTIPGYDGPVVNFDGTNDAISVADHASLEAVDSTGFTYQQWIKFDNAAADAAQIVADKTGTSQANNQWTVYWDNRSSQGSPLRLRVSWGDNPAGTGNVDWSGTAARDALNTGGLLTVVFSPASIGYIYWNDELVASGETYNYPAAPGNAANTLPLRIGSLNGSSFWFDGKMGAGAVYPRDLDQWEIAALHAEGAGDPVVEVAEVAAPAKLFETADYDAFPGVVLCPNGDLLAMWRKGTAHTTASSGQGIYSSRSTDDGATWGSASNAISNDASTNFMTAALSVIGSDVWLVTWVRSLAGGTPNPASAVRLYSSSDNGATWTLSATLDLSSWFSVSAVSESALVYFGGYYYLGAYGQVSGTANDFEAGVFRSSDLSSWSRVAHFDTGIDGYTETGVTLVGSTLVAVIRHNSGRDHYTSTSTDGTTWSSPVKARDVSSGAARPSNGPGERSYFIARLGDPVATAYLGTVDDTGTIREVLKLNQAQNMYGQVAAVDDERIVGVWSVQASSSDADIYSAIWDVTGYAQSITDDTATAAAAAHLEAPSIPLALTDSAATSAAAAHVDVVAIGVALTDDPATASASAPLETLAIPLAITDAAATAAAAAHLEVVSGLGGTLDVTDDPATSFARAYPELVDTNTLGPWEGGAHGEALLNLEPAAGVLEVTYPATEAPATIVEVSLQRASHQMPALSGVRAMDYPIETDVVGTPHVWVDGVDVTYFRDSPSKIGGWRQEAPFGWTSTTLTFPQVFHYEERGTGDLAWMVADAPVEIAIVTPLGARLHRFTGHLTSEDPGVGRGRTECVWGVEGALWQADHAHHPVLARLDPTDMGELVTAELNGTPSRRFSPIANVFTDIPMRQRGSTGQTRWEYVTDLLAKATVDGGDQWTIEPTGPRSFRLALKDTTTVHWTISAGAPGVELDLNHDHHERIDAVYGRGIGPDGYAWRNVFFPDLLPYDPPDYPYADPDQNVLEGDTDADTLTGDGISVWQRRIRELGYSSLPVDGVMGPEDTAAIRWIQAKMGIEVDGYMAGQTWAATWNVGAVGGDLRTVRLPMAVRPEVEQFIYAANGATVGTNPDYDPTIIRHEIDVDFGAGVTKAQGREMARRILERGLDPGIVGTVKLTTCPWEGSRWEVDAGDNVLIKGWRGEDVLCRITALEADPESLTVTLTVDSEFRDAMAVVQILERNRESRPDPARRPGNPNRRSRQDQDQVTPFEGESPAGRLPRLPLYEGLWTVWPVPVSEVGLIAKLRIFTDDPVSKFAVSLWGRPVTANQIAAKVPDPLAETNPWQAAGDDWLDDMGFVDAWGEEGEAAGFGLLGRESEGDPLTGELIDEAGVPYVSLVSPWLWVGLYSPVSTFIEGRIYPEPTQ